MVIYNCYNCNYETDRICNLNKHKKTKKHIENVARDTKVVEGYSKVTLNEHNTKVVEDHLGVMPNEQNMQSTIINDNICDDGIKNDKDKDMEHKHVCSYCGNIYSYKSGLSNHIKMCGKKEDIINKYENKIKHDSEIIKHLEDKIKLLTDDRISFKNIAEATIETAKVSTNALSFAIKNYKNAPAIQTFSNFKLLLGNETKFSVAEIAIHYYNKKELAMYIGNILIKEYKKENPYDQSIHNTDTTRSAYIIREIIDEESEWLADKGAIKTSKYTIKPILDYLKKHLNAYFEESKLLISSDTTNRLFRNMITVQEIISNIDSGLLNKDIIKYISAYFFINKKTIKNIELDEIIGD